MRLESGRWVWEDRGVVRVSGGREGDWSVWSVGGRPWSSRIGVSGEMDLGVEF